MGKASFTAALSEGHPCSSLIRARASQSAASNRMVVAGVLCRSVIPQLYHIGRALTFTANTPFASGSRRPPSSLFVGNKSFTGTCQSPPISAHTLDKWMALWDTMSVVKLKQERGENQAF